jgi:ATP adenylyltransferase
VYNGYFFCFDKLAYVQGKRPSGCILCHIRDKNKYVVNLSIYRNEYFVVCINLYPYNPGHIFIFPVRHITDIRDYTEEEERNFTRLQKTFINVLDNIYNPQGYNIGYNMGLASGASIEHLHCHIIPRYPREIGIADLIAGKKVLVESPYDTKTRIKEYLKKNPIE